MPPYSLLHTIFMPFTLELQTAVKALHQVAIVNRQQAIETIANHPDIIGLSDESDLIAFCNDLPHFSNSFEIDEVLYKILQAMPEERRTTFALLTHTLLKTASLSSIELDAPNQLKHRSLRTLTLDIKKSFNLLILHINNPEILRELYYVCFALLSADLNGGLNNIEIINQIKDNAQSLCTSLAVQMITTPESASHLQQLLSIKLKNTDQQLLAINTLLRSVYVLGAINLSWSLARFEEALQWLPVKSTVFYAHHHTIAQGYLGLLNYLNIQDQFFQCKKIIAIVKELSKQDNRNMIKVYRHALAHMIPHLSAQHKTEIHAIITTAIDHPSTSSCFSQLLTQINTPFLANITPLIMMPLQEQAPAQNIYALNLEQEDLESLNWIELLYEQLLDNDIIDQTENVAQLIAFLSSPDATAEDIVLIWDEITHYLAIKEDDEVNVDQEEKLVSILQTIISRFQSFFSSQEISRSSESLIRIATNGREYITYDIFNLLCGIVPTADASCNSIIWRHLLNRLYEVIASAESEFNDDDVQECADDIQYLILLFGLLFPHVSRIDKQFFWQSLNELLFQDYITENFLVVYGAIINSLTAIAPHIATGDREESRLQVILYRNALLLMLAHFNFIIPPGQPMPFSDWGTNSLSVIARNDYHQLYPLTMQAFAAMAPCIQDADNIAWFHHQLKPLFDQETIIAQNPTLALAAMAWTRPITPSVDIMNNLCTHINNPARYNDPHQCYSLSVQLFALASFSITGRVANAFAFNSALNGLYHLITHTNPSMQTSGLETLNRLTETLVKRLLITQKMRARDIPLELSDIISSYHHYLDNVFVQYDQIALKRCEIVCETFYLRLLKQLKAALPTSAPENQASINAAITVIETCWKLPVPVAANPHLLLNNQNNRPKRSREVDIIITDSDAPLAKYLRSGKKY